MTTLSLITSRVIFLWYLLKDRWRDFLNEIKIFFQSIFSFISEKSTIELLLYFGVIIFLVWMSLYGYDFLKKKIKKKRLSEKFSFVIYLKSVVFVGGIFLSIFLGKYIILLYTFFLIFILIVIEDLFFITDL